MGFSRQEYWSWVAVSSSRVPFFFPLFFFFKFFFFICSGFCHTLKWNSHGFTCVPHPNPPSHLPLHPLPLGLPSAPGPSACLMHPTWAGDLFHPRVPFPTQGSNRWPLHSRQILYCWATQKAQLMLSRETIEFLCYLVNYLGFSSWFSDFVGC